MNLTHVLGPGEQARPGGRRTLFSRQDVCRCVIELIDGQNIEASLNERID